MDRRRRTHLAAALLAALATLVIAIAAAGPADAATILCRAGAPVPLSVARAASTPAVVGSTAATLGTAGAQALATNLQSQGDVCSAPASPRVQAALTRVLALAAAGNYPAARSLLHQTLAMIRALRTPAAVTRAPSVVLSTCAASKEIKIHAKDAPKVGDYLKAAAAAQAAKDAAASQQAIQAADQAYSDWTKGQTESTDGKSVGDMISIARGAEQLGLDGAASAAMAAAQTAARRDVVNASKIDACTANLGDMQCETRAIAVAQMVGADVGDEMARASAIAQAVQDRLEHKIPDGCEEWSFDMKLTDGQTGWTIRWAAGRFRVSRKTGTIDGSQAAGYGPGWPLVISDLTSECIETTDQGTIDHGPGTIHGGNYHYAIGGSVTSDGFSLQISSQDATISVTAPPDLACQFLAGMGQMILDAFVKGPFPIDIPLSAGQTSATLSDSANGTDFTVSIQRISS